MIGSKVRGRASTGALVQGTVYDKVNVPMQMEVPDGTIGGKMTMMVGTDAYLILDDENKTYLVPVASVTIVAIQARPQRPAPAAQARTGAAPTAEDEDEADLDLINRAFSGQ